MRAFFPSVLSALLLSSSLAVAAADFKPLRIGLISPLTGGSADFGNSMRLGAELAVKEINEVGGYQGRPLELVVRDDMAQPDVGRKAAEELVLKEKVAYTIGFCNTGVALKSIPVFQEHRHILMVPCSTGTAVTATYPAAGSFIFRVAPTDAMKAKFLVNEVAGRRQFTKVAILADNTPYGQGGVDDVSAELARRKIRPVLVSRFDLGVSSLVDAMRAARQAGAEAVVVYTVGPEQAVAVKARHDIGWNAPYFAPWPLSFRGVLEGAGAEALEGTMMAQTVIQDAANERRATFAARYVRYSKETKMGSMMAAAQAYDAVHLMLRALFVSKGDTSGTALKAALENLPNSYQGVVTTYKHPFSAGDHDAFSQNMIWLGVWRRGEIRFFHADDARLSAQVRHKE